MYDHILVPTDGSKATDSIIEQAIVYARTFDADIHCLYAIVPTQTATPYGATSAFYQGKESIGEDALSVLKEAIPEDIDVTTQLEHGSPPTVICDYATENEIDLIMMGTRGYSGFERLLTGSVTEKVIRKTDDPVLVTHR